MRFDLSIALSEPRIAFDFIDGDSRLGIRIQKSGQKPLEIRRHPLGAPELALVDLLVHVHQIRVVERQIPGGEHEQDDAARPHVYLRAVVAPLGEDLRRHVRRRAAERVQEPVVPDLIRQRAQPEIGDLQTPIVVQQQVLRLQIAVVDAAEVAVADGADQLLEVLPAQILAEPALGHFREQLPALDEFQNKINLSPGGENFEKLDDVGVAQAAHDRDLTLDVVHEIGAILELALVDDFDSDALAGGDIPSVVHLGKGAAAQKFPDLVLVKQGVLRRQSHGGGGRGRQRRRRGAGARSFFDLRHR